MRVRVRYDTPNEKGQTRRERNIDYGVEEKSPALEIPIEGLYLWDWYFKLSSTIRRVRDGICEPIPPSEFIAWCKASGTIVHPIEYAILCAMDAEFCSETNAELAAYKARQEAEREKPPK